MWAEDEAALLASAAGSAAELDALVGRRAAGEPVEQLVGWAGFRGLRIAVDTGVFVPRRRSEFLAGVAVRRAAGPGGSGGPVIADLCCGTGALGLAVAASLAGVVSLGGAASLGGADDLLDLGRLAAGAGGTGVAARLHAADLDPAAVACARRNVEPAGGHVYQGDLFAALPRSLRGQVGVLICNAPYVPTAEIAFMPAEARDHEARLALDGGDDGLTVLRRAAAGAPAWLAPGGELLVETSERQAPAMAAAMRAAGLAAHVHEDDESGATVVSGAVSASR